MTTTPKRAPRKAGNPPDSKWRSTPAAERGRKVTGFTLSEEVRAEIELQADEHHDGNKSAAVEAAVWAAAPPERRPPPKP